MDSESFTPDELRIDAAWVRRLAGALCGDASVAEDLAQDAWVAALEQAPDRSRPLRPWLAAVARNLARLRRRTAVRAEARARKLLDEEGSPPADELLARVELERELIDLVCALAEPQRTVVLLRYHEGMSAARIARERNVPAGTVRWQLKSGLDQVRAAFAKRHGAGSLRALALLPLASHKSLAALVEGAFLMSRALKLGLLVLLAVLAGALLWHSNEASRDSTPEAPAVATSGAPREPSAQHESSATALGAGLQRLTISPQREAALRGALISARTREPVAPGTISVTPLELGQTQPARDLPAAATLVIATESDGTFTFRGLARGRYVLEASSPGYARETRTVQAPSAELVELALRDAAFLSGFVVREDGSPAAGAQVLALAGNGEVSAVSGPGGGFSMEVPPGMHALFARDGKLAGRLAAPVEAKPGETVGGLQLVLRAGSSISGHVRGGAGKKNHAVADALVSLSLAAATRPSPQAAQRTAPDGQFVFEGLAAGEYIVEASAAGYARAEPMRLAITSGAPGTLELNLTAAAGLEGRVVGTGGTPIQEAVVSLLGDSPRETPVDLDGHYAFDGLSPGSAVVSARRPGETIGASKSVTLVAEEVAHAELTLGTLSRVHGTVRWRSGKAVSTPVRVTAMPPSGISNGADSGGMDTDESGTYSLQLNPGDYMLSARPIGWVNTTAGAPVTLGAGEDKEVDVTLPQDGPDDGIHGQVYEPGGAPSIKPIITALVDGHGRNFRAREDGTFDMPLPQGEGSVRLFARNGGRVGNATADAQANHAVIQLAPAALLRGEVHRADGAPIRALSISLQYTAPPWPPFDPPWPEFFDRTLSIDGSTIALDDVTPGGVHLTATAPDGASGSQDLQLSPGQTGLVDLQLSTAPR